MIFDNDFLDIQNDMAIKTGWKLCVRSMCQNTKCWSSEGYVVNSFKVNYGVVTNEFGRFLGQ